jgi:hypothetical protein
VKKIDILGGLGVHGTITVNDLKEIGCQDVDWIRMTQDRVQWRALVNMELSTAYYKRRKTFYPAERLSPSNEDCSTDLEVI